MRPTSVRIRLAEEMRAIVEDWRLDQEQREWLDSIYVRMADGRIAHPSSGTYVDALPERAVVWDPLSLFHAFTRDDGAPGRAEPYQEEFLRSCARMSLFRGGVGSGKTVVAIASLISAALLNPGGLSIVGVAGAKLLAVNVLPKLERHVPQWAINVPRHPHLGTRYLRLNRFGYWELRWKNGHVTYALTLEERSGAHMRIQGPDACFLWVDEASIIGERPAKTFLERLRDERGMLTQAIFTTSPDEPGWIEDLFFGDEVDREMISVVEASTTDASFRSPSYVESLKAVLTPDEFRRKVLGETVYYEGLVYEDHLPSRIPEGQMDAVRRGEPWGPWMEFHVDRDIPIVIGVDFGERRAAYVAAQETTWRGRTVDVVWDEGEVADASTQELGYHILEKYGNYRIDAIYTDYNPRSEPERRILRGILRGTQVLPAVADSQRRYYGVRQGVRFVWQRCRDHDGSRHLYIALPLYGNTGRGKDTITLREALGKYRFPMEKRRIHVLDALRYLELGWRGDMGGTVRGIR